MHFRGDREKSAHGGAVFLERSVRSGRAYMEGSRHGASRRGSLRGMLSGSVRGGSFFGGSRDPSVALRRLDSSAAGDRSYVGERSVHGGGAMPAGM